MPARGFCQDERIKKRSDYLRAKQEGTAFHDGVFILALRKNDMSCHRLGITISRACVKEASRRNRLKRLIREVFRARKSLIRKGPFDIIVIVKRKPAFPVSLDYVDAHIERLLRRHTVLS